MVNLPISQFLSGTIILVFLVYPGVVVLAVVVPGFSVVEGLVVVVVSPQPTQIATTGSCPSWGFRFAFPPDTWTV